jgi:hypothetical protein
MRLGPQPRRARGTIDHPNSALNLRLWLAAYGFLTCTFMTGLLWWLGFHVPALLIGVLAVVALVDGVVVQIRRRRTREARRAARQTPP